MASFLEKAAFGIVKGGAEAILQKQLEAKSRGKELANLAFAKAYEKNEKYEQDLSDATFKLRKINSLTGSYRVTKALIKEYGTDIETIQEKAEKLRELSDNLGQSTADILKLQSDKDIKFDIDDMAKYFVERPTGKTPKLTEATGLQKALGIDTQKEFDKVLKQQLESADISYDQDDADISFDDVPDIEMPRYAPNTDYLAKSKLATEAAMDALRNGDKELANKLMRKAEENLKIYNIGKKESKEKPDYLTPNQTKSTIEYVRVAIADHLGFSDSYYIDEATGRHRFAPGPISTFNRLISSKITRDINRGILIGGKHIYPELLAQAEAIIDQDGIPVLDIDENNNPVMIEAVSVEDKQGILLRDQWNKYSNKTPTVPNQTSDNTTQTSNVDLNKLKNQYNAAKNESAQQAVINIVIRSFEDVTNAEQAKAKLGVK